METVFLGLTTLDVVQRVDARPRLGTKQVVGSTELVAGGPAANAAVTAASMRGSATLVTGLGTSPAARLGRDDLEAHGVRIVDLVPPGNHDFVLPTSSCVIEPDGARTVFSTSALTSRLHLNDQARQALSRAGVLMLDGHHPVAAGMALGQVADTDCLLVLDAGSVKPAAESWLSWLDVVVGSADYAEGLGTDLAGAVQHVLDRGATAAVMTDGAADVLWRTPVDGGRVRPPQVDAVDTLGAGDAFHGALVAALVDNGGDLGRAVRTAADVASRRVQHAGARGWLHA